METRKAKSQKKARSSYFSARHEHLISVSDSTSLNHCLQTSYIGNTLQPLRYGPPSYRHLTGQPSKDILLIKCLELGVVIGVAMACCSVTNISHLQTPSGPKV